MAKLKVKTGDNVVVTTGKDAGKQGKILSAYPKEGKVIVEGVNVATKSRKPRSAQDKGGLTKVNLKIDSSNVMFVCPSCKKATRIGYKIENGEKVRFCKKCGKIVSDKVAVKPVKEAKTEEAPKKESVAKKVAPKTAEKKETAEKK